jgi:hypothetical protein
VDYRRPAARAAMKELLGSVARRCDGVRCDMAMLLLNEVFARTWQEFHLPGSAPAGEFWADAIATVKGARAGFLFLAEVYWGLEARLQALGFDYTYDKGLYDRLAARDAAGVQRHVLGLPQATLAAGAHFLENHDEPRIASILAPAEHRAAALVVLGLPGLRLLHEGQLAGARVRIPVQLARRPVETANPEVRAIYDEMLAALLRSGVGRGRGEPLEPRPATPDNRSVESVVLAQWHAGPEGFDLVAVNLALQASQCYAPVTFAERSVREWEVKDLIGRGEPTCWRQEEGSLGFYLDLAPNGARLIRFRPLGGGNK